MAGLQRFGTFLSEGSTPRNASYGAALLKAGGELQAAVLASVAVCQLTDPASGKVVFLPPYAEVNSTKYLRTPLFPPPSGVGVSQNVGL